MTKQEYKELETKEEEIRYCGTCTKDIFPFYEVNNILQHKILIKSGRPISNNNKDIAEIKSKIKIKKKNNFMARFHRWGSTASRQEPLRGGSLLFTTKFSEIPGTHFINLERMKS